MVLEGGFNFLKNTVIFDPIDRIWNFGFFQPSVHSERAYLPYSIYGFGK